MISVVLSGGGAKGAFQAGVLKALHDQGVRPDLIVGTSVGALNAAGLSHLGIDGVLDTWRSIRGIKDVFRDRWWRLPFNGAGRYSLEPLAAKLATLTAVPLKPDAPEAVACYVDLRTTKAHYASNREDSPQEFAKAVLASAAIPFYMEPVDGYLVDGGVREVAPVQEALDTMDWRGELYVITCQPLVEGQASDPFDQSYPRALSLGLRALDIRDHETLINDLDAVAQTVDGMEPLLSGLNVTLFSPPEYLYSTFDFRPAQLARAMELGMQVGLTGGRRWV